MARVKVGVTAHARHKKILKMAKGYRGTRHAQFKKANELVMKALYYARRDRRAKKREFRKLWIVRINIRDTNKSLGLIPVHATSPDYRHERACPG